MKNVIFVFLLKGNDVSGSSKHFRECFGSFLSLMYGIIL